MYGNNNPYFQPRYSNMNMGQQFGQQISQFIPQQVQNLQPAIQQPIISGLQGKIIESVEMVKTTEIPYDGSLNFFPLVNGTAIFTKQLQADGTIKTIEYRPIIEKDINTEKKETIKYVTIEDLNKAIEDIDFSELEDLKEDISDIKKQLKEFKSKKVKED